mmetsp:Transcript_61869/g.99878  ORF Transcript_61869/g.99878 Transcript_61869/m.99878 type:complete len:214 (+) Transcript_61869:190-831(+)
MGLPSSRKAPSEVLGFNKLLISSNAWSTSFRSALSCSLSACRSILPILLFSMISCMTSFLVFFFLGPSSSSFSSGEMGTSAWLVLTPSESSSYMVDSWVSKSNTLRFRLASCWRCRTRRSHMRSSSLLLLSCGSRLSMNTLFLFRFSNSTPNVRLRSSMPATPFRSLGFSKLKSSCACAPSFLARFAAFFLRRPPFLAFFFFPSLPAAMLRSA